MEHGSYAVKRGFFAGEMDLKHLPQWFYEELRSTGAVTTGATETWGYGDEHEEHRRTPPQICSSKAEETHQSWGRAEVAAVIWSESG